MKICVFVPDDNKRHINALHAFATGVGIYGDSAEVWPVKKYRECDVAVVFGTRKERVPASYARGDIIAHQAKIGRHTVVIDSGYIHRDKYYMVGLDGLNGRASFNNRNVKSDRWDALQVPMAPWRTVGSHIIVAGQVPWDASCQHVDNAKWCRDIIDALKFKTARPIVFRPHPMVANVLNYGIDDRMISMAPLADDLRDAWALVTFNSNTSVDAVLAGIPIFVGDEGAMTLPVANTDIDRIERPLMPDRLSWAHGIAYAQWTLEEFANGLPWAHLRKCC